MLVPCLYFWENLPVGDTSAGSGGAHVQGREDDCSDGGRRFLSLYQYEGLRSRMPKMYQFDQYYSYEQRNYAGSEKSENV